MKTTDFFEQLDNLNDRFIHEAMEYQAPQQKVIPFRKSLRIWIAACFALMLVIPVSAELMYGTISNLLTPLYGVQSELVDTLGTPIGESIEIGDYTLTADAAIGDSYSLAIVYTLARTDGQPMEQPVCFSSAKPRISSSIDYTTRYIPSSDGSKVNIIQKWSAGKKRYQNQKISVTFKNLSLLLSDYSFSDPILFGEWRMQFPVKYENSSVQLLSEPLTVENYEGVHYTFRNVEISPVGLYVDVKALREDFDLQPVLSNILSQSEVGKESTLYADSMLFPSSSNYSMPIDVLPEGSQVEVLRIETIGGVEWAYVKIPGTDHTGWITSDFIFYANNLFFHGANLRLRDGSVISLQLRNTSSMDIDNSAAEVTLKKSILFDTPIRLADMESLIICGQEIPIIG